MNEDFDLNTAERIDSVSELPTTDGPTLRGRKIVAGRYEILSKLGGGGMGDVWHAFDVKLRVDVALKSLRFDWKGSQDPVEALRREVRTAREVVSPNVCRIFDLVVEEDTELISMEYIDGVTLLSMLSKKGAIELRQARDLAAQFLAGLQAIHHAGLVHRDLKPENIMITRTGRVAVMDFGIAKQETQISGTISGTIPYMSPEQLAGEKVDARSDVFSAGVVLAEMIHPEGLLKQKTREEIWNAVRQDPMRLPDGPWKPVIARAVASNPTDRFPSAAALARALEEATQRVDTTEERKPYPGLASFTATDAEYFFGRELEVETLIKKLQQLHFTALIGPSGTGKTSMLSAGLIPALPDVWSHVVCYPGDSPLVNLAQALAPQLSGDAEAFAKMVRFEEPEAAVWVLKRWRQKHSETLLIIDRFEELFTLNNTETQTRFSELLGRAVLEADVRVLLTMRDDFLMFSHQQPALLPIFSELTGLSPLGGAGLRRALVQPALKCGYRFEDEILVDEILSDVERERGALPLMAFAAAQLWERRDRESGELRRAAYMEIGGVAGALAKHAEQTMSRIGTEREPIVREIFRNLITAQNTRAARDTEELLSVFPEKDAAEEVLRTLIDARLLTSFEAPQSEGEKPRSRVEIIHESLLSNWPRLVRWQTQDADSAQLRDQLRQAAQLWEQRKRSEDLLWTGTAFLEFQAWRQRYSGGLTATEEAFAHAMSQRANRRRRQRRIAVAVAFAVLFGILTVIGVFWRGAEFARDQAVLEARRAEAGKLVALGRGELEKDPSQALAYAIASMEEADTPDGRFLALKALWKGPAYSALESTIRPLSHVEFSPDGKRLVLGGTGGVHLIHHDGAPPLVLTDYYPKDAPFRWPSFTPDGEYVIWRSSRDVKVVKVWSLSQKKAVREFHMEGFTSLKVRGSKVFFITDMTGQVMITGKFGRIRVRSWDMSDSEPKVLGHWDRTESMYWDIDPAGKFLAYARGMDIYIRPLDRLDTAPETHIGKHASDVTAVTFHPDGEQIATADSSGEIRIRPFLPDSKKEPRVFFEKGGVSWSGLYFDPSASYLAIKVGEAEVRLRDLSAPAEARSFSVYKGAYDLVHHVAFHPIEPRIIVVTRERVLVYAFGRKHPYELQEGQYGGWDVHFAPDGRSLVTSFSGRPIQLWQLSDHGISSKRDIPNSFVSMNRTAVDPRGRFILTSAGETNLLSLVDETVQSLPELLSELKNGGVAISANGEFAAAATAVGPPENLGIEIWNIEARTVRMLQQTKGKPFMSLNFLPDGSLIAGDIEGNLWHCNLQKDTGTVLFKKDGMVFDLAVSPDGRIVAATVLSTKQLGEVQRATSELILYDITENKSRLITSHGNRVCGVVFASDGQTLVTGDLDGIVRVGSITGDAPHVLLENESPAFSVAVHPAGKWIAAAERSRPIVRLWRMPQGRPFHTLPYEEFLNRLRAMTNVRVVKDPSGSTGYKIEYAPFPGWKELPTW